MTDNFQYSLRGGKKKCKCRPDRKVIKSKIAEVINRESRDVSRVKQGRVNGVEGGEVVEVRVWQGKVKNGRKRDRRGRGDQGVIEEDS